MINLHRLYNHYLNTDKKHDLVDERIISYGWRDDGEKLIDALKKLSVDNLSNLNPHPAYVFVNYSHPPIHERIKAIRN